MLRSRVHAVAGGRPRFGCDLCFARKVLGVVSGAIMYPQSGGADDFKVVDESLVDHASMGMHRPACTSPIFLIPTKLSILLLCRQKQLPLLCHGRWLALLGLAV